MKYFNEYKQLHEKQKYGISGDRIVDDLLKHIPMDVKSLLDYGAGQSNTALLISKKRRIADVYAYDPCVKGRDKKPHRNFDFVTCTDVLEHVPEEELNELLVEIWGLQEKGAIFVIALGPAGQLLPNGENAHCTVKPKEWWEKKLKDIFKDVIEITDMSRKYSYVTFLVKNGDPSAS